MEEKDTATPKDFWDILRILGIFVSMVAVPVIIAVVGHGVNVSLKERDVRLRTVELAIGILKEDPKKGSRETKALRQWAMNVIDKYSGVPLTKDARSELQEAPITRSLFNEFSCRGGRIRLEVPPYAFVQITEDIEAKTCEMLVDGTGVGEGQAITCENFKASVYFPDRYVGTMTESKDFCAIILRAR